MRDSSRFAKLAHTNIYQGQKPRISFVAQIFPVMYYKPKLFLGIHSHAIGRIPKHDVQGLLHLQDML